jgi:hypothetical protein
LRGGGALFTLTNGWFGRIITPMADATHDEVIAATRTWLRPVIHVLLRSGITWREFAELAKATYVEVATRHFGRRGRPTNVSRTSILTGLARRDVRKQRELLEHGPTAPAPFVTKASLVLSAWHLLPEYRDRKGRPVPLAFEGDGRSFIELVQRCAGSDVPPTTLLKELVSSGAVRTRPDGRLEATGRNYIPHAMEGQMIRLWGSVLADVATTHVHNLSRTRKGRARFERAAVNDEVDAASVPEFARFLEQEGQAFLERVDAWLTAHQVDASKKSAKARPVRLGAGVYHVQDL